MGLATHSAFSHNQTGTLLIHHLAHFVAAVDSLLLKADAKFKSRTWLNSII